MMPPPVHSEANQVLKSLDFTYIGNSLAGAYALDFDASSFEAKNKNSKGFKLVRECGFE